MKKLLFLLTILVLTSCTWIDQADTIVKCPCVCTSINQDGLELSQEYQSQYLVVL